jgi:hypothetical protein
MFNHPTPRGACWIRLTEPPIACRWRNNLDAWKCLLGGRRKADDPRQFLVVSHITGHQTTPSVPSSKKGFWLHLRWMHILMRTSRNLNLIIDRHHERLVLEAFEPCLRSGNVPRSIGVPLVGWRLDGRAIGVAAAASVWLVWIKGCLVYNVVALLALNIKSEPRGACKIPGYTVWG